MNYPGEGFEEILAIGEELYGKFGKPTVYNIGGDPATTHVCYTFTNPLDDRHTINITVNALGITYEQFYSPRGISERIEIPHRLVTDRVYLMLTQAVESIRVGFIYAGFMDDEDGGDT